METLQSKVISILKNECSYAGSISMYMKHIIVQSDSPDRARRKALKEEIKELVDHHFPEREENLVFVLTGGQLKDEDFRLDRKLATKTSQRN